MLVFVLFNQESVALPAEADVIRLEIVQLRELKLSDILQLLPVLLVETSESRLIVGFLVIEVRLAKVFMLQLLKSMAALLKLLLKLRVLKSGR